MAEDKHENGNLESRKFEGRRDGFYQYLDFLERKQIERSDMLEHIGAYIGHMSLNRLFTLYEYYRMVKDVAGHIAEIGVFKGAGSLLFSKLVKIFEAESLTQVHGFDWFKGTGELDEFDSELLSKGGYSCSHEELLELAELQDLNHILRIHNFDLTSNQVDLFFDKHRHLQFKMVFFDAGFYQIMKKCLPLFWERLTPGGIMVFDQYNFELAPGETISVREILPDAKVRTLPNSWMPNAYIIK